MQKSKPNFRCLAVLKRNASDLSILLFEPINTPPSLPSIYSALLFNLFCLNVRRSSRKPILSVLCFRACFSSGLSRLWSLRWILWKNPTMWVSKNSHRYLLLFFPHSMIILHTKHARLLLTRNIFLITVYSILWKRVKNNKITKIMSL
jgi:hypothetical protein